MKIVVYLIGLWKMWAIDALLDDKLYVLEKIMVVDLLADKLLEIKLVVLDKLLWFAESTTNAG